MVNMVMVNMVVMAIMATRVGERQTRSTPATPRTLPGAEQKDRSRPCTTLKSILLGTPPEFSRRPAVSRPPRPSARPTRLPSPHS
eukprot:8543550-Alexandrium_andersonii.AAC.1